MSTRLLDSKGLFLTLTLIVVAGGMVYWCSDLSSDAPMYYSGLGQSLSTDPAQYVFHARNQVLFGQFDPFDYPRFTVFQHSLTSFVAYVLFSITGVSLETANLVGPILGCLGLIFLILGLIRSHRWWVTTAVALCYVANVTLVTHFRLPYLENGLIFWASVLFFVYSWWGNRLWGVVLCGALTACAAFTGKLFGGLLIAALIPAIVLSREKQRQRHAMAAIGSFVVSSGLLILVLYGKNFMAAFSYVGEQSLALHGLPFGLTSPWAFLERLISYGFSNHLFYLDPDLWLLGIVGGILFVVAGGTRGLKERSRAYRLALFWAVVGIIGLSPLNYSPIRYATLIIPGIILFGILAFETTLTIRRPTKMLLGRGDLVVLLFVFWFAMYHFVGNMIYFNQSVDRWMVWGLLMGAVPAAYGMLYLLKKRGGLISSRMLLTGLTVVLALSLTTNTFRNRRLHFQDHNFNIAEANTDIAQIIGDDAVVSGSYGPAITVGTNLRSFIHMFGVAQLDSTLFDRQPITHLALDDDNLAEALRSYPKLADLPAIATYYVRDYRVRLFNISRVFENRQARAYQPYFLAKSWLTMLTASLSNWPICIRLISTSRCSAAGLSR